MSMYAVAITPLIQRLSEESVKQVWFADDASAGGQLEHLKKMNISQMGPEYGYYPNASKTWLVVKEVKQKTFSRNRNSYYLSGEETLGVNDRNKLLLKRKSLDGREKLNNCRKLPRHSRKQHMLLFLMD